MNAAVLRERLRSRAVQLSLAGVLAAALVAIFLSITITGDSVSVSSRFIAGTPENGTPVRLDTSLYLPDSTPAPAVLLSQGFGGDKHDLDSTARSYAEH